MTPKGGRISVCALAKRSELVAAATELIERFYPSHYYTLTYAKPLDWEGRYKAVARWLDGIEWLQRRNIGWLRADESRFSGLGFPAIPEHHHGLLVGVSFVSCLTMEKLWRSEFGDAQVVPYVPHGGAIPYCLKLAFHRCGDWDIGGKALRNITQRRPPNKS